MAYKCFLSIYSLFFIILMFSFEEQKILIFWRNLFNLLFKI